MLIPFAWRGLFLYSGVFVFLVIIYLKHEYGSSIWDFAAWGVSMFLVGTYFSWILLVGLAHSVTLSEDGVTISLLRVVIPLSRSRKSRTVEWQSIRDVDTLAASGSITINPFGREGEMNLNYGQARAVLTDPRCPLRDKLPSKITARIGATAGLTQ